MRDFSQRQVLEKTRVPKRDYNFQVLVYAQNLKGRQHSKVISLKRLLQPELAHNMIFKRLKKWVKSILPAK